MILKIASFLAGVAHIGFMNLTSTPVTTRQQAILIGTKAAHAIYSSIVDFDQLSVAKVKDEGDNWCVWFTKPPIPPVVEENGFIKCTAHLGGGPEIYIDKATGKIVGWKLFK